ncbi:hypothetical protein [Streptomyces sp. Ac-502]|uniref:hypothetical protein n=1 Tax=Streptomyces sp. Ac-502 TaxID=3342801 RepID=UPI0038626175
MPLPRQHPYVLPLDLQLRTPGQVLRRVDRPQPGMVTELFLDLRHPLPQALDDLARPSLAVHVRRRQQPPLPGPADLPPLKLQLTRQLVRPERLPLTG